MASKKTHCKQGHPYDKQNTYWHLNHKGYECRGCRACVREAVARRRLEPGVKEANAEKSARWREAHPEEYRAAYIKTQEEKRQILLTARASGCLICDEKDPSCLDFHHRNGKEDKLGHIGYIRRFSKVRIYAEIAKCDVLCSNCHRKLHAEERAQQKLKKAA